MIQQRVFAKDAAYQKFEVLRTNRNKRYKYRQFFVEGVRNLNEAVKNGWQIHAFLYQAGRPLSAWAEGMLRDVPADIHYELSGQLMEEISGKTDASELLAIVHMRDDAADTIVYGKAPLLALFDRPSNKGNLGTLLRSMDALGADGLIITGHAVDVYEPEVLQASMGSFFNVPFLRLSDNAQIDDYIAKLRSGYPDLKVVGTTAHKQTPIYTVDLTGPVLFLIGNETDGLNQHLCELCDVTATIPMTEASSASSFNVSCAATVLLYEAARQRGK